MSLAMQTGLRISELLGLDCGDIVLGTGAHVRCDGKGRKQRSVPLTDAVRSIVAVWLDERRGQPSRTRFRHPLRTAPQRRRRPATGSHCTPKAPQRSALHCKGNT